MRRTLKMFFGVMILISLVGCNHIADAMQKEAKLNDIQKITYWVDINSGSMSVLTSYEATAFVNEETDIEIEFVHPEPEQAAEAFKLLMASRKDLPDIIETNWLMAYPGGPEKAIKGGIIRDITPYLEEYAPHYKMLIESDTELLKESKTDSGAIYGFHAINDLSQRIFGGFVIRQDWLEELGLSIPETIKEWEEVLTAFKEKKGCLAPLAITMSSLIEHMLPAYGINQGFYLKEGKVKYGAIQPEYKEFLVTMNRWYEAGLMDSNFASINQKTVRANIIHEKAGAAFEKFSEDIINEYQSKAKLTIRLVPVLVPTLEKGEKLEVLPSSYSHRIGNATAAITTGAKQVETIVSWFDTKYKEGEIQGQALTGKNLEIFNQGIETASKNMLPPIVATPSESRELVGVLNEINSYIAEKTIGFIMGIESLDKFDEFVEHINYLGIQRAIKIQQAGVDRYNNR